MPIGFDLRGEKAPLAGVGERGVAVTGSGVGVGEVDEQAGAGPDKVGRQAGEGGGELVDRVGGADAGKGVTAPTIEVGIPKEQKRQRGIDRVGREQVRGGVEDSPRFIGMPGGSEGFAVCGG